MRHKTCSDATEELLVVQILLEFEPARLSVGSLNAFTAWRHSGDTLFDVWTLLPAVGTTAELLGVWLCLWLQLYCLLTASLFCLTLGPSRQLADQDCHAGPEHHKPAGCIVGVLSTTGAAAFLWQPYLAVAGEAINGGEL